MTALQAGLRAADFLGEMVGLPRRALVPESLMTLARRRSGLQDFGAATEEIAEPLRQLVRACAAEAVLSTVGRIALRWDAIRLLGNLLRLNEEERRDPTIACENIAAPIVITGLPRSGTTFLHQMMLCDPANRAPLVLEAISPYPEEGEKRDRREQRVAKQIRMFERLAPEFRSLHPLTARSPQECTEILAHTFRSLRFDTTYRIPSYRIWLEASSERHLPAYRLHRRFLQHLQHAGGAAGAGKRWVLKCPDHLFALPALKAIYPDARLVFVHRDPVKVLLSLAKLTEVLRRPFSRRVDPIEIGRQESMRWLEGAERMIVESGGGGVWRGPIAHVHYLDLVADPATTVTAVYRQFGLVLPKTAEKAIRYADKATPRGGYALHRYRFEDHGLNAVEEREKFRPYMTAFGVTPETSEETVWSARGAMPALRGGAAKSMAGG